MRTQTALALCGASEAPTFATRIDAKLLRTVWLQGVNDASFVREMVEHGPQEHPLTPVLRDLLWRYECRTLGHEFASRLTQATPRRVWEWIASRTRNLSARN